MSSNELEMYWQIALCDISSKSEKEKLNSHSFRSFLKWTQPTQLSVYLPEHPLPWWVDGRGRGRRTQKVEGFINSKPLEWRQESKTSCWTLHGCCLQNNADALSFMATLWDGRRKLRIDPWPFLSPVKSFPHNWLLPPRLGLRPKWHPIPYIG